MLLQQPLDLAELTVRRGIITQTSILTNQQRSWFFSQWVRSHGL
jgi:hypothetical protein